MTGIHPLRRHRLHRAGTAFRRRLTRLRSETDPGVRACILQTMAAIADGIAFNLGCDHPDYPFGAVLGDLLRAVAASERGQVIYGSPVTSGPVLWPGTRSQVAGTLWHQLARTRDREQRAAILSALAIVTADAGAAEFLANMADTETATIRGCFQPTAQLLAGATAS